MCKEFEHYAQNTGTLYTVYILHNCVCMHIYVHVYLGVRHVSYALLLYSLLTLQTNLTFHLLDFDETFVKGLS